MTEEIKALRLENEELKEEINLLKGWISLISHNNTEIFGSLKWMIEAYDDQTISKEDFFKLLPQIKKDVTKHLQTSKDTREWLRTQFGGFKPQLNPINALNLFTQLNEEYENILEQKSLLFEFKGDPKLEVVTDKILLYFILSKVLHNAIKYSNKGQIIHFEASKTDTNYVLSIIDYGIGISQENLKSIYSFDNPVYQGTNGEIGAGLGLKIVQYFVSLLTGSIEFESSSPGGTTVILRLPVI